jgi:phosphopantetheine--protein transferase-like protein
MEEKIKEIVSTYIKVPKDQIGTGTPIGRAALGNSILLHRMYARLGEEGIVVSDYAEINVFGDLMRKQEGGDLLNSIPVMQSQAADTTGVGIDIEEVAALPRVADLRRETFYTQNFTPAEIAYCILQADPYVSLAGLWAAKEAIVKADGQWRNRPFNTIEIGHTMDGKPEFASMGLSISHAGGVAVAVAFLGTKTSSAPEMPKTAEKQTSTGWISWIALILAAAALLLGLKH